MDQLGCLLVFRGLRFQVFVRVSEERVCIVVAAAGLDYALGSLGFFLEKDVFSVRLIRISFETDVFHGATIEVNVLYDVREWAFFAMRFLRNILV